MLQKGNAGLKPAHHLPSANCGVSFNTFIGVKLTNKFKYIGMLSFFLYSSIALSANYTGKVQSLHVNMTSNTAHVQFEGKPKINQSGCSDSWWTGNSLDDQKFMKYIWPLLMTAQAKGEEVTINTNGCNGSHANIYWIDYKPRL